MKKIFIYALPALAVAAVSCADGYEGDFRMEKPESVELSERLASYEILTKYAAEAGLGIGTNVDPQTFAAQGLPYSIAVTNFNEVEAQGVFLPKPLMTEDNGYDFSALSALAETAQKGNIKLFGPALCTSSNLPSAYLKSLIEDVVIPYQPWEETILEDDFEGYEDGKKFPSSKKNTGSVDVFIKEDPQGTHGKVLACKTLTMDIPKVENIKLPAGFTLADVVLVKFDCLLEEGTPTASRIQIESTGYSEKANPYKNTGVWSEYVFDLSLMKFKDSELAQNSFSISGGAYGSKVSCCIDNLTIVLNHARGEDTVISKSDVEKREIMQGELDKWTDGVLTACDGSVADFIIYNEPLDDEFATFRWNDYLGDGYIKSVQDKVNASVASAKYYVSQSLVVSPTFTADVDALKAEIAKIENAGVKVDGVNIALSATYTLDYSAQLAIDKVTKEAVEALARLGKPVRISNFTVNVTDVNGVQTSPSRLTLEGRQAVAEYYELVMKTFRNALGSNAAAFSIGGVQDSGAAVAPWAASGDRNFIYEGIVRGLSK